VSVCVRERERERERERGRERERESNHLYRDAILVVYMHHIYECCVLFVDTQYVIINAIIVFVSSKF